MFHLRHFSTFCLLAAVTVVAPSFTRAQATVEDFPALKNLPDGEYRFQVWAFSSEAKVERPWGPPHAAKQSAIDEYNETVAAYGPDGIMAGATDKPRNPYVKAIPVSGGASVAAAPQPQETDPVGPTTERPVANEAGEDAGGCTHQADPDHPNWDKADPNIVFEVRVERRNERERKTVSTRTYRTKKEAVKAACSLERLSHTGVGPFASAEDQAAEYVILLEERNYGLIYNPPKEWVDLSPRSSPSVPSATSKVVSGVATEQKYAIRFRERQTDGNWTPWSEFGLFSKKSGEEAADQMRRDGMEATLVPR